MISCGICFLQTSVMTISRSIHVAADGIILSFLSIYSCPYWVLLLHGFAVVAASRALCSCGARPSPYTSPAEPALGRAGIAALWRVGFAWVGGVERVSPALAGGLYRRAAREAHLQTFSDSPSALAEVVAPCRRVWTADVSRAVGRHCSGEGPGTRET